MKITSVPFSSVFELLSFFSARASSNFCTTSSQFSPIRLVSFHRIGSESPSYLHDEVRVCDSTYFKFVMKFSQSQIHGLSFNKTTGTLASTVNVFKRFPPRFSHSSEGKSLNVSSSILSKKQLLKSKIFRFGRTNCRDSRCFRRFVLRFSFSR